MQDYEAVHDPMGRDDARDGPAPESPAAADWSDVAPILDEALDRLPPKLREAVILRHLSGLSRRETADQLGCSAGAAAARIAGGLDHLRRFLAGRGVAVAPAVLPALLGRAADAAVPERFVQRTLAICSGAAPIPPAVSAAMDGIDSAPEVEHALQSEDR